MAYKHRKETGYPILLTFGSTSESQGCLGENFYDFVVYFVIVIFLRQFLYIYIYIWWYNSAFDILWIDLNRNLKYSQAQFIVLFGLFWPESSLTGFLPRFEELEQAEKEANACEKENESLGDDQQNTSIQIDEHHSSGHILPITPYQSCRWNILSLFW